MWTTASTVDEALAQLQMTDKAPAAASRGSRVPLAGMSLPVVSAKTVQINDGGVVRTVRLAAPNVAALLDAAGVPLQQSDTVVPAPASPVVDGMQIAGHPDPHREGHRAHAAARRPTSASRMSTLNMSRQVVEDPGTPGDAGRHVCRREGQRGRNRQIASSQCRRYAGPRRCAAGRRQARHRGASGDQRSHLGRALALRSRR